MTANTDLIDRLAASLPAEVALRDETDADRDFMTQLYASTRAEELAVVSWPEAVKQRFLRSQCELQRDHYRKHYPSARFWVIERHNQPIGRLYLQQGASELRIMDIALLPEQRGRGIGNVLMTGLLAHARTLGTSVTLHVEPLNPAQRLYSRLGFRLLEDRGDLSLSGMAGGSVEHDLIAHPVGVRSKWHHE
ncbi:MAG: GNAT family N-acetyltransferase [Candidatus Competibacteraceae bacterium]|nr:GNAT family N-acetyltransferase [Candidatus Competibacteraceae bacterium]